MRIFARICWTLDRAWKYSLKLNPFVFMPFIHVCPHTEYHSKQCCNYWKKAETQFLDWWPTYVALYGFHALLSQAGLGSHVGDVSNEGKAGMMTCFISWRNKLAQRGGIISASLLIILIKRG
jgi:hypothetical protein